MEEKEIKEEIEKTINLSIKEIAPSPFLYTRIKAGINSQKEKSVKPDFLAALGGARLALAGILFIINVISVFYYFNTETASSSSANEYINFFEEDYFIAESGNYLSNLE